MSALKPPKIQTEDPGAHEMDESSDDHFSSASEGSPNPMSPVPVTRVERVDDNPAHGEVPGTAAYAQRTQDAVPDEIEIVPEGSRSRSGTRTRALSNLSAASHDSRPQSAGGSPVPKTVVERVDDNPAYGEVDGTAAKEMRMADAEPDEVKRVDPREGRGESDEKGSAVSEERRQEWFRNMWEGGHGVPASETTKAKVEIPEQQGDEQFNDDDDFDDFAEEQEGGDEDDDFGDFDEADETPMAPEPQAQQPPPPPPNPLAHLPKLDLSSSDSTSSTLPAYLDAIFPPTDTSSQPEAQPSNVPGTAFLSDRSLSLWQQLLQPPPMAPPNWTRSRIRRLFLVSLGVPVDLDEILPPSKQKRLVLPNINLPSETRSPRHSTTLDRLKQSSASANASRTSLDSKGAPSRKMQKRSTLRDPPPPPDFDLNAAALLAATTTEALQNKTDEELKEHAEVLQEMNEGASRVLEYWLMRRDEGVREKEAFEGVVANLVGFVKGRRGGK